MVVQCTTTVSIFGRSWRKLGKNYFSTAAILRLIWQCSCIILCIAASVVARRPAVRLLGVSSLNLGRASARPFSFGDRPRVSDGRCRRAVAEPPLHHDAIDPAAELEACCREEPRAREACLFMETDRGRIGAVAD